MGGFGSGASKGYGLTSDHRSIDVRRLAREGLLTPGHAFAWRWSRDGEEVASIQIRTEAERLILHYRHRRDGGDWQPMEYAVDLEWTSLHFGGRRAWFVCPAVGCGRRVALLYLGGSGIFACRRCYRLAYPVERETETDRAARRADTIRRRLGWEPGILNGNGWKPKGMHWRTYDRLVLEHDRHVQTALNGMMAWLERRRG